MDLTPTRYSTLQRLFEQALVLPAGERLAFLDERCKGDHIVRDEVLALLHAHESNPGTFSLPSAVARSSGPAPDPGQFLGLRLGPWRVTRFVGMGGMGTVCEGERADAQFEKRVAVKLLHRHVDRPGAVQRFLAERQMLATLDHPNIAMLLDGGVTESGQPYLVMEYVDGLPLTTWADAQRQDHRERIKLFLQVCAAVEAAHRNLIVHRDLKPGNVLVNRDGLVKLLDFGIARLLDPDGEPADAGRVAASLSFTPSYAAPEQIRNEPLSTASDVFSLGVLLYELLTARLPFSPDDRMPLHATPAGLDRDIDAILAKSLRYQPADRYASVSELRSDLERYLGGLPVTAIPDSRRYRAGKFFRRHRLGTVATATAAAAILVASGIAFHQAKVAHRAAADTRQLNDFLLQVFQMSDPFNSGTELTLSAALDEAATQIDKQFAGRPDLSAEIRFGIGYSMASRYRLEQAQVQLRRALTESLAEFGPDDIRTLRVSEGIAGLLLEQGKLGDAEGEYRKVIAQLERLGRQGDPLYVKALGNLGNVHLQQERYPDSYRVLQQAMAAEARASAPDPMDHAGLLSNLAHAAHGLENYPLAERYYDEAQKAFEKLFPDGSPDLATIINNRALLHEDQGDFVTAGKLHVQSLAVRRKVFGDSHPMVVVALSNNARAALKTGDAVAALAFATEGARIADKVYTEPNRFHPSIYATLAAAQIDGNDIPAAATSLQRARQLLAALPEAPPSVVRWVEEVRVKLCSRKGAPAATCRTGSR